MTEYLVGRQASRLRIDIDHEVAVPIGAGFGTSAAGTLSAAIALADALDLKLTLNEIAMVTHRAEVVSNTGLGTVPALLQGGFVLVRVAGGPGLAVLDKIPFESSLRIVACHFGPISTEKALSTHGIRSRVNAQGRRTLRRILENPTPRSFMSECRKFAEHLGLLSIQARRAISMANEVGAVGATQNMLGDAIHALVELEDSAKLCNRFRRAFPRAVVFTSRIQQGGARLI
jgi:pantoate kinase